MQHQQTIELAIDLQTDRRIAAGELLTMSEAAFSALRRTVMANRIQRERTGAAPMLVCGICLKPLYISRFIRNEGNRWFEHDGASPDCPWYGRNRLSPELRRALIYRGQQEGERHRTIKNFVADFLEKEVGITSVNRELVTHGQILRGEWKRPDVQCVWRNSRIVFEIQLSYTFLSDVIKRDEFYRKEGIHIIWLFDFLDLRKATVRDEAFFNRRNLFVFDVSAMDESRRSGRLTFNGTFQAPVLMESGIADEWQSRFITLDDIQFPTPSYRPFFFDYDAARGDLERQRAAAERWRIEQEQQALRHEMLRQRQLETSAWESLVQRYLVSAIAYYDSDYAQTLRQPILEVVDEMYESSFWHRGFECLSDEQFFGWHRALPVLLSMKLDRPVGYHKYRSAYQVLEAAVRQTSRGRSFAFAVPYLWASYIYKTNLNPKQKRWREKLARDIKRSVMQGESKFQRITCFDEAIGLLFPELEKKICSQFATQSYIEQRLQVRDRNAHDGDSARP